VQAELIGDGGQQYTARQVTAPASSHSLRLRQLPSVELAHYHGRYGNSRVVSELANYLADRLVNA
jgi:hypothetical protein